jgi:hypothetical protein
MLGGALRYRVPPRVRRAHPEMTRVSRLVTAIDWKLAWSGNGLARVALPSEYRAAVQRR